MTRTASFIDAACFERLLKQEFEGASVDFRLLAKKMAGGREVLRTYYYDCLPYMGTPPKWDERERWARKHRFLTALAHLPRFQVRLGRLEFRGLDGNEKPVFEQKRVDVAKGVDLAVLAAKHLITDAAILAGDSDFIPAVEAAKAEGVVIHLFHGPHAHQDLIEACDERVPITQAFVESITRGPAAQVVAV